MSQSGIPVVSDIAGGLNDLASGVDDLVNEIPGGWGTVAALTGAAYYGGLPSFSSLGSASSNAAALALEDAAFYAADAAQLAGQGLSAAQIESTLVYAGANPLVAADAAQLASQGLSERAIAQNLAQSGAPTSISGSPISAKKVLDAAKSLKGLTGGTPAQPQSAGMINPIRQQGGLYGQINYEPIISLLTSGRASTPNVSSLLG
jgi:hypothetical protein